MKNKIFSAITLENHEIDFFIVFTIVFFAITALLSLFRNPTILITTYSLLPIPIVYKILKFEEIKDIKKPVFQPWSLHYKAIGLYGILFFSLSLAVSLAVIVLPQSILNSAFSTQHNTINEINSYTGNFAHGTYFLVIISNNLRILFLSLALSLVFGIGSLIILTWNATVFGYVIGEGIRAALRMSIHKPVYDGIITTILRYSLHGIPEILSYLVAAFAGGLLYAGILNHNIHSKMFKKVVYDSLDLTIMSIVLLIIAGLIEAYITPALFY